MKKITTKCHERDIIRGHRLRRRYLKHRKHRRFAHKRSSESTQWKDNLKWIEDCVKLGYLDIERNSKRLTIIHLPEVLNFSSHYDQTVANFNIIRMLVGGPHTATNALKLRYVDFSKVRSLSTSASIVLAAELSRWDDYETGRLTPRHETWDPAIVAQLRQFGFFGLFREVSVSSESNALHKTSDISFIPYIKGRHGETDHRRELKQSIEAIIGDKVDKWIVLSAGLSEAITNVTHHAYPDSAHTADKEKTWFMGGSFDKRDQTLRIVFFDQGIGIPKSLPASKVWENVLSFLTKIRIPFADRKKDATLLKAAVEYERTSTNDPDRGKGLQDLLDFIRERKDGYLSIFSGKGLYRYSMAMGNESCKTETFSQPINGTLIIWKVRLNRA